MNQWLLVDGNSLVTYLWFRGSGRFTSQQLWLYLAHLVDTYELHRIAVAWDSAGKSKGLCRRRMLYDGYKRLRVVQPEWLQARNQVFAEVHESLKLLPVRSGYLLGLEADDLVWCWSRQVEGLVVSSDKDLWQCVDRDGVRLWSPRDKQVVDHDSIKEIYGSVRAMMVQKALIGDVSDCVLGVKGIGKARAQRLWLAHGNKLYEMLESNRSFGVDDRWFQAVVEQEEVFKRNWQLLKLGKLIKDEDRVLAESLLHKKVKFNNDAARHHAAYMGWHEVIKKWPQMSSAFQQVCS